MSAALSFDDRAPTWDADPVNQERALAVATALLQRIPLSKTWQALEYGCGTGLLSSELQGDIGEVTLADCLPGMLTVLEEKISAAGLTHLHPLALDLTTDPLPAERYELIYTLMTLHHFPNTTRLLRDFYNFRFPDPEWSFAA